MEYVQMGAVSDTTPPPAPFNVRAWPKGAKGEAGTEIVWNAEADFESGIGGFVVLRDGRELAKLPKTPVGKFGRPLFQAMTYHDTPAQPLAEMRYLDTSAQAGKHHTYEVITVNSVGLKSGPSVKAEPYPRVNMSTWYQVDPDVARTTQKRQLGAHVRRGRGRSGQRVGFGPDRSARSSVSAGRQVPARVGRRIARYSAPVEARPPRQRMAGRLGKPCGFAMYAARKAVIRTLGNPRRAWLRR